MSPCDCFDGQCLGDSGQICTQTLTDHRGLWHMSEMYIVLKILSDNIFSGYFCFLIVENLIFMGFCLTWFVYRTFFIRRSECQCLITPFMLFTYVLIDFIAIIAPVAELKWASLSLLSNRTCWVFSRYIVMLVVVPAEMKVIKSHASRSKLIAARAWKFFSA